jgi:hypothetical protein
MPQHVEGFKSSKRCPKMEMRNGRCIDVHIKRKLATGLLESMDTTALNFILLGDKNHELLNQPSFHSLAQLLDKMNCGKQPLSVSDWVKLVVLMRNKEFGHREGASMPTDDYTRAVNIMSTFLHFCKFDELNSKLQEYQQITFASQTEIGRVKELRGAEACEQLRTKLTSEQAKQFQNLVAVEAGQKLLVQAPSGSGKTVLIVKLAAQFLLDEYAKVQFRESSKPKTLLLIVHSKSLLEQMVDDIQEELLSEVAENESYANAMVMVETQGTHNRDAAVLFKVSVETQPASAVLGSVIYCATIDAVTSSVITADLIDEVEWEEYDGCSFAGCDLYEGEAMECASQEAEEQFVAQQKARCLEQVPTLGRSAGCIGVIRTEKN